MVLPTVTKTFICKLNKVIDAGLVKGLGSSKPGQMCIEAAVNYAKGANHNDSPICVHSVVRAFAIALNDAVWSSNQARAEGMRGLAIAQLGTAESFDVMHFNTEIAEFEVFYAVG
jgi:hypothetical protein